MGTGQGAVALLCLPYQGPGCLETASKREPGWPGPFQQALCLLAAPRTHRDANTHTHTHTQRCECHSQEGDCGFCNSHYTVLRWVSTKRERTRHPTADVDHHTE